MTNHRRDNSKFVRNNYNLDFCNNVGSGKLLCHPPDRGYRWSPCRISGSQRADKECKATKMDSRGPITWIDNMGLDIKITLNCLSFFKGGRF